MNLLHETMEMLERNKRSSADVNFVLFKGQWCTFKEFVEIANFEYDEGYGGNEIDLSVKIVGDNWWLARGEYDGSEWWEFLTLPTKFNLPHKTPTEEDIRTR